MPRAPEDIREGSSSQKGEGVGCLIEKPECIYGQSRELLAPCYFCQSIFFFNFHGCMTTLFPVFLFFKRLILLQLSCTFLVMHTVLWVQTYCFLVCKWPERKKPHSILTKGTTLRYHRLCVTVINGFDFGGFLLWWGK